MEDTDKTRYIVSKYTGTIDYHGGETVCLCNTAENAIDVARALALIKSNADTFYVACKRFLAEPMFNETTDLVSYNNKKVVFQSFAIFKTGKENPMQDWEEFPPKPKEGI